MRVDDAVHQVCEAVEEPCLHGLRGVRGNDFARIANLHAPEPRRAREKRIRGNADARHQRSAQIFAVRGNDVKVDGRAEVHDNARPAVFGECRHAVRDAVGADFLRVVVLDGHAGAHARLDEQRLSMKVALGHFLERAVQRRHDGADDHAANFARDRAPPA